MKLIEKILFVAIALVLALILMVVATWPASASSSPPAVSAITKYIKQTRHPEGTSLTRYQSWRYIKAYNKALSKNEGCTQCMKNLKKANARAIWGMWGTAEVYACRARTSAWAYRRAQNSR